MDLPGKQEPIGKKYKLLTRIGGGGFGDIYLGVRVDNNQEVAIKLERKWSDKGQLEYEHKIYRILQGGIGIPNIHWYGEEGNYRIMVIDRLGPSLHDLFHVSPHPFSLKTVLMFANQILNILEFFHEKSLIHRDIKPSNILIGIGENSSKVYIVDYGLAKKYRHPKTLEHVAYRDRKHFAGTTKYASIYTHLGIEQGRRDDLESLGYTFINFLKGSLPWQDESGSTTTTRRDKILDKKVKISVQELCEGLPEEFAIYFSYIRQLHFEDCPGYAYLKQLFKTRFLNEGYEYDSIFDWNISAQNDCSEEQKNKEIKVKENEEKNSLKIQEMVIEKHKNIEEEKQDLEQVVEKK